MSEMKPKLPRSVVILNIIMIVLILMICALAFSLAFSSAKEEAGSADTQSSAESDETEDFTETVDISKLIYSTHASSSEQTTRITVSMTKRSAEPDEPVEPESLPSSDNPDGGDSSSGSYTKSFFENDLFIGDSISTGLYLYGKLDMKNVAAGIGYTPYKAYTETVDLYDGTSATALDYAAKMQPKRIFIMLGSNGMGEGYDSDAMKSSYRTLTEKLAEACPDSEICCISVSPVTADSSGAAYSGLNNDMITEFNAFIAELCAEKGLRYFDTYSLLIDENGYFSADYAEVDGLHFLGATYDVMLSYIQSELS